VEEDAFTVSPAVPFTPESVAVIVALPADTPVASPVDPPTVATGVLLLDHVAVFVIVALLPSE
jgi:hypothetical protein